MRTSCFITVAMILGGSVHADEAAKTARKLAEEISQSFVKGDYNRITDLTHEPLIEFLGGRDKALAATKAALKSAKDQGIEMESYKTAEPGEIVKDAGKSYIIIPATMVLQAPDAKIVVKSYLLGISPDDGKTWKFLDGAGLHNNELRSKVLPDLPAKVKLPGPVQPEIIKK